MLLRLVGLILHAQNVNTVEKWKDKVRRTSAEPDIGGTEQARRWLSEEMKLCRVEVHRALLEPH